MQITMLKKVFRSYLVEVAYFFFFLARHMSLPLFQEYIQAETLKQHNETSHSSVPKTSNFTDDIDWRHAAQQESAVFVLSLQIAEGLPAVITVLFLGVLSDRTGRRKILLWLPSVGSCAFSMLYILQLYTGWNMDGLFMASALRGLSGSMTAFFAGSTFYAINSVATEHRSSRLAVQEFLNGAAYTIGNIMVGFWVNDAGFLPSFWFIFVCSLIACFISVFGVEELPGRPPETTTTGNCCVDFFKPMLKLFKCRDIQFAKTWLAILAFQTYAFLHFGQLNTLVLYLLGSPYNWLPAKIGVFLSVMMACSAIGTAIAVLVLRRYLSDLNIALIGLFSKALGSLWIAVVQNEVVLYFAIFLMVFQLLPFPMFRSIASKGVSQADQGSLFAVMHAGESLTYFLAPLMFTGIYAGTLSYYSGLVFVISVILFIIPAGLTIGHRFLEERNVELYRPVEDDSEIVPDGSLPIIATPSSEAPSELIESSDVNPASL